MFWIDQIGDRWEAQGVDPGNIWEVSLQLTEDLEPGAVIETVADLKPGVRPRSPTQIKRVLVILKRGKNGAPEEIEMHGLRPLVVANFLRIVGYMS